MLSNFENLVGKMSKITTVSPINNENGETINHSDGKSLEQERLDHKIMADKRWKLFEDIINNRKSEYDSSSFNASTTIAF